ASEADGHHRAAKDGDVMRAFAARSALLEMRLAQGERQAAHFAAPAILDRAARIGRQHVMRLGPLETGACIGLWIVCKAKRACQCAVDAVLGFLHRPGAWRIDPPTGPADQNRADPE